MPDNNTVDMVSDTSTFTKKRKKSPDPNNDDDVTLLLNTSVDHCKKQDSDTRGGSALNFETIDNETAFSKLYGDIFGMRHLFHEDGIRVSPLIYSKCTYPGLTTGLNDLVDRLKTRGSISEIFVICPHYAVGNNLNWLGGDTQVAPGGKVVRWKNPSSCDGWEYEEHQDAVRRECEEEMRISVNNCYELTRTSMTTIYECKASDCNPVRSFNPDVHGLKNRGGIDTKQKVACIIWGSYKTCEHLVTQIPCMEKERGLIDSIEGVDIVSLHNVIQMARYADIETVKREKLVIAKRRLVRGK